MYASNGKSEAWGRIKKLTRHLCLTVTHESPPEIWNMILSLPNLRTIEVIGEYSEDPKGPPTALGLLQKPAATKVQNVRLRGYVPVEFVSAICRASASTIVSLDLGILEEPQLFEPDEEEETNDWRTRRRTYYIPSGDMRHLEVNWPSLTRLTHLLLCKPGPFDLPVDIPEEEEERYSGMLQDLEKEAAEMKQWASLLRSIRLTAVEVVLEHRAILRSSHVMDEDVSIRKVLVDSPLDIRFREDVVENVFAEGWPKLKTLIFRGMGSSLMEPEESIEELVKDKLPRTLSKNVCRSYMFVDTSQGSALN